jgi:hypothetical protein
MIDLDVDLEVKIEKFLINYPRIVEPLAKPSDFGIGPREFFYWVKQGIIDVKKTETVQAAWNRLNMYDAIWIRLIQELRKFNIPFKVIAAIKAELFQSATATLFSLDDSLLEQTLIEQNGAEKGRGVYKDMQAIKADPHRLAEIMEKLTDTHIAIHMYSVVVFQKTVKFHFLIDENQVNMIAETNILKNDESLKILEERNHLTINFYNLVTEFLVDLRFEKMNRDFGFISENEKILFDALKDKNIREINIKKDQHNNTKFEMTSTTELRDDEVIQLKKLLRMNHYEEVHVVYRNDKHLILQNTKKIKTTTP